MYYDGCSGNLGYHLFHHWLHIIIIITFPQYVYKFYVWIWILNFILWFLGFYVGILWKLQILIIIVFKKTPSEWKKPFP
jgi:hypothetical protein